MSVAVRELKACLSRVLLRAQEGEVIEVTSHNKPIARIVGIPSCAGEGVRAVSYTHLDVYKRQAACRASSRVSARISTPTIRRLSGSTAVSYTHLDVYKRQPVIVGRIRIRWLGNRRTPLGCTT